MGKCGIIILEYIRSKENMCPLQLFEVLTMEMSLANQVVSHENECVSLTVG
jgi:hypothetical protein